MKKGNLPQASFLPTSMPLMPLKFVDQVPFLLKCGRDKNLVLMCLLYINRQSHCTMVVEEWKIYEFHPLYGRPSKGVFGVVCEL